MDYALTPIIGGITIIHVEHGILYGDHVVCSPLSVAARMDTHFGAQCRQMVSAAVTEVLLLLDSDLCLHESTDNRICVLDKLFLLVAFCGFRICNCFLKISKSLLLLGLCSSAYSGILALCVLHSKVCDVPSSCSTSLSFVWKGLTLEFCLAVQPVVCCSVMFSCTFKI